MVIRPKKQQHNSSYGYQSSQSSRGAKATPSDRIRCSMGEWKQRNQFSNKALSNFDFMVRDGQATPQNSLVTCREHTSSGQPTELLCQGPCGRVRSANDFSKASKRNKKMWCKDCTDWQTADPDHNLPPPGTELSIDELVQVKKGDQAIDVRDEVLPSDDNGHHSARSSARSSARIPVRYLDEDDEEDDDETVDTQSSAFTSDDEDDDLTSGYWSDDSEGTVHAGLGSFHPTQTEKSLELLSTYTRSARSQIASSASQPDTSSVASSTVATSARATSKATIEVRPNGWARERKPPKPLQAPNYIRHGCLPSEQEHRRLRGEDSDDSF